MARLGYDNVEVQQDDGHMGYPQHVTYDGIIVTAAASFVPNPLKEQLKPGGRLVIPVELPHSIQHLMVIDSWLAPAHRYFKVQGDDDIFYILRHDNVAGH